MPGKEGTKGKFHKKYVADTEALQISRACREWKSLPCPSNTAAATTAVGATPAPPSCQRKCSAPSSGQEQAGGKSSELAEDLERPSKRLKLQSPSVSEQQSRQDAGVEPPSPPVMPRYSAITPLQTLKATARNERVGTSANSATWDVFVLILQCSGLQQVTSKEGYEMNQSTLLVADPTSSFFRVTLWRQTAQCAARMIRPGDLVRLNRISVSSFRGKIQATSTSRTLFRVIWRNDTFTTPSDANSSASTSTMFARSISTSHDRGERRHSPDPALSQDSDLEVPRKVACDLAVWAKLEFPSVTLSESGRSSVDQGCDGKKHPSVCPVATSLKNIRKGIETTVRACVLEVSAVERMWTWESAGGQRRKELVSRATTLLTDGEGNELTLQLWSDLASDGILTKLRAAAPQGSPSRVRAVAASGEETQRANDDAATGSGWNGDKPCVFEFTRLRPDFHSTCEALVLNTTSNSEVKQLDPQSKEALDIANAVLDGATAMTTLGSAHLVDYRHADTTGQTSNGSYEAGIQCSPSVARVFSSVNELLAAEGYSGMARLVGVVVREFLVDPPRESAALTTSSPTFSGAPCAGGPAALFLGDPANRNSGGESIVRVLVDGEALRDVLVGIPWEASALCGTASLGGSIWPHSNGVAEQAAACVARSLLDGLVQGGREGELLDAVLACVASADENGRFVQGGTSYRLAQLHAHLAP